MDLAQTRYKGSGVAVGETWGKQEPKLGEGEVRNGERGGVGTASTATRGCRTCRRWRLAADT